MTEPREGDALLCPECERSWLVSVEDPDATFGELLSHVRRRHPEVDQTPGVLWPRVRLLEAPR